MARRAGPLGTCDGSTEAVCSVVAVPFMSKPYQGISREPRARYPRMTCRQKGHTVLLPVGPDGKKAQMPRLPRRVIDAHRMHSCGQANEAVSAGSWHALMAGGVAGRLEVNASLGLSSAVKSADAVVDGNASLGDRTTVLLINTAVTRGRGEAVVTATGMATETGRIAELLHQAKPDPTRLRHQIDATINTTAFSLDVAPLSSTVANATSWYRTACGSLPWAARSTGCQLVQ
jgi:hypothetical protein